MVSPVRWLDGNYHDRFDRVVRPVNHGVTADEFYLALTRRGIHFDVVTGREWLFSQAQDELRDFASLGTLCGNQV